MTTEQFQMGYEQGLNDVFDEGAKPAPDCRTCNRKGYCKDGIEMHCTNGDKYQEAIKLVLWRTE